MENNKESRSDLAAAVEVLDSIQFNLIDSLTSTNEFLISSLSLASRVSSISHCSATWNMWAHSDFHSIAKKKLFNSPKVFDFIDRRRVHHKSKYKTEMWRLGKAKRMKWTLRDCAVELMMSQHRILHHYTTLAFTALPVHKRLLDITWACTCCSAFFPPTHALPPHRIDCMILSSHCFYQVKLHSNTTTSRNREEKKSIPSIR